LQANLFDNRVHVDFNFYKSWTSDLLTLQSLNFLSGLDANWSNGGKLENTGFDAGVGFNCCLSRIGNGRWVPARPLQEQDYRVARRQAVHRYRALRCRHPFSGGQAANLFYGYQTAGVFSTTEQANDAALYVLDDNGVTKHYFAAAT
jgi:hypothetical protein